MDYDEVMEVSKEKWQASRREIKPEIKHLFYKGNVELLLDKAPRLAVVGSRRMTDYGLRVVEKWLPELVQAGVTIVSGFMYGVDQAAHRVCLENGGKTIAVLGWGIDWPVKSEDANLYKKILEVDSLIVSEYADTLAPEMWMFPQRNRIVAGVVDAVLVVEAAEKSGSLITARLAREQGKKLLAVPGGVFSKVSAGTNGLIRTGSARMVASAGDVLSELGLAVGQVRLDLEGTPKNPILAVLEAGERSTDELGRALKLPVTKVMEMIFELEMEGVVETVNGKVGRK